MRHLVIFPILVVYSAGQVREPRQNAGILDQTSLESGFGGGGGGSAGIENSRFFQEIYMLQTGPKQIEFGHVCESPTEWEQRYERKDFDTNRHQGQFSNNDIDNESLTGFWVCVLSDSYQHLPEHDKYEFGFRRGNDHHVKERYEKAAPHEGHFKTKVRWADHRGGQGEHYWDYNHAGNGGDDGEGDFSDPVPTYAETRKSATPQKRQLQVEDSERKAYEENTKIADILAASSISEPVKKQSQGFVGSLEEEIGKIEGFEIRREGTKLKRTPTVKAPEKVQPQRTPEKIQPQRAPQLFFDLETGRVIDELTGKAYVLKLVN